MAPQPVIPISLTPGARLVPKAGSDGKIASGWIPDLSGIYAALVHTHAAGAIVSGTIDAARLPDLSSVYQPLNATLTGLNGKSVAGSGAIVLATSPTIATPTLTNPAIDSSTLNGITKVRLTASGNGYGIRFTAGLGVENVNFQGHDTGTVSYAFFSTNRQYSGSAWQALTGASARSGGSLQVENDALVYYTFPGGSNTPTERFRVNSSGLTAFPDIDATTILGRLRVDGSTADTAILRHYDQSGNGGYVAFGATGAVTVNSASGQTLSLRVNGSSVLDVTSAIVTTAQPLSVQSDLYTIFNDANNNVRNQFYIRRRLSSGTPNTSLGSAIIFQINSTTTADQNAARIRSQWQTATDASRVGSLILSAYNVASEVDVLTLMPTNGGSVGIGGTPIRRLHVHSDGILIGSAESGVDYIRLLASNGSGEPEITLFNTGAVDARLTSGSATRATGTTAIKANVSLEAAGALLAGAGIMSAATAQAVGAAGSLILRSANATPSFTKFIEAGAAFRGAIGFPAGSGNMTFELGGTENTFGSGTTVLTLSTTAITIANAVNIILNTTTGTKIGTATSQKLSLWNQTPDIQPTTAIAAAAFVANTSGIANDTATFGGYTIGQIVAALKRIGALA